MRKDDHNEFVVVINFSNRPCTGWVEVMNDEEFQPVKINGMNEGPKRGFPLFRLSGFEWRIYRRSVFP
jgi:hypothetical protein